MAKKIQKGILFIAAWLVFSVKAQYLQPNKEDG